MTTKERGRARQGKDAAPAVQDGQCWAIPLPGVGVCPVVIARAPRPKADVDFAFAYVKAVPTILPLTLSEVGYVETWPATWLGLVPTRPMRTGRWHYCGMLPGFEPAEWPIPPSASAAFELWWPEDWKARCAGNEMWSIETTADEPTPTIIANTPCTREEAEIFPRTAFTSSASRLEKALLAYFKDRSTGYWDMKLVLCTIPPGLVKQWNDYAERVRAEWSPSSVRWLPAGRRTDRNMKAGMWMGLPLQGGGFGAAILVAKPDRHLRFFSDSIVMAMRRRWDRWPTLEEMIKLRPEDGAMLSQTSMVVVRDGRWRVFGEHPNFDPEEWVWPRPWWEVNPRSGDGLISVTVAANQHVKVQIDPEVLRLEPQAGARLRGMSTAGTFEWLVPQVLAGTRQPTQEGGHNSDHIVTPQRLHAWRTINAEVRRALAAKGVKNW